jgi:hypothetical protein
MNWIRTLWDRQSPKMSHCGRRRNRLAAGAYSRRTWGHDRSGSSPSFESVVGFLSDPAAGALTRGELEERLELEAREQFRLLYQEHLDLRAAAETRLATVADAEGWPGPPQSQVTAGAWRRSSGTSGSPAWPTGRRRAPTCTLPTSILNLPAERHSGEMAMGRGR